ncbi:HlyD family efflux transporter periplasmic adaptor subunit [Salegentibacter sp. F188]|uniref:HlyD family efflux transporter periplasmic adaptor subunit n=1 Tax=Autumnicola patrickiae TaxID=3075591 RepID=A0ABU3E4Z9_9FLAO|nr:HlyD family efflux transporter periplasmic adaptor subunit [Salegentibacter sp. F188]MDT0691073.1 HlyD family efflux transporter periplasmic adaptor subunit [Salegentibacter sp. F188]
MENRKYNSSGSNPLNIEPGYLLRRGTAYMFGFFFLVLILAGIISFNQVVKGSVTLTSKNPPVEIKVKRDGKLSAIYYKPGDSIVAGDIVAVLDNPASQKDITFLKERLGKDFLKVLSLEALLTEFPVNLSLGTSLQAAYNRFLEEYHNLILENTLGHKQIMEQGLLQNINNQRSILNSKEEEFQLMENSLSISTENINRHRQLFEKGVISKFDLEKVELEFTEKNRQYSLLKQQMIQLQADKSRAKSDLEILRSSEERKLSLQEAELVFAKQNLLNEISEWEDKNIIKSPVAGRLSYNQVWGVHQNVEEGDVVFTIVPFMRKDLLGKCIVPVQNSGQINKGQKVYLKLDNYPYREWGMIKASVKSISEVPSRAEVPAYIVYLDVDSLVTSYGKELILHQELIGTAEIVLEEVTLLKRIFYQFRQLWTT